MVQVRQGHIGHCSVIADMCESAIADSVHGQNLLSGQCICYQLFLSPDRLNTDVFRFVQQYHYHESCTAWQLRGELMMLLMIPTDLCLCIAKHSQYTVNKFINVWCLSGWLR